MASVEQLIIKFAESGITSLTTKIAKLQATIALLEQSGTKVPGRITKQLAQYGKVFEKLGGPGIADAEMFKKINEVSLVQQRRFEDEQAKLAIRATKRQEQIVRDQARTLVMENRRIMIERSILREAEKISADADRLTARRIATMEKAAAAEAKIAARQQTARSKSLMGIPGRMTGMAGDAAGTISRTARGGLFEGIVVTSAATGLAKLAQGLAETGGRAMVARQQFENTAKIMGTMGSTLLPALENASLGTISKLELMRLTNYALAAGLKLSEQQTLKLTEAAVKLGLVHGRDAPEAYQRLVNGIVKGERKILDELAIILDARDAYKQYADSIDGATDDMDRQAKIASFLKFTLAAGQRQMDTFANVNFRVAAAGLKMSKVFEDFKDKLSLMFVESGAAERVLMSLEKVLGSLIARFQDPATFKQITDSMVNAVGSVFNLGAAAVKVFVDLLPVMQLVIENLKLIASLQVGLSIAKAGAAFGPKGAIIGLGLGLVASGTTYSYLDSKTKNLENRGADVTRHMRNAYIDPAPPPIMAQ